MFVKEKRSTNYLQNGKIVAKKTGTATIKVTLKSGYTTWFKVKVQKNAVATVNSKGIVTAKKKGTAIITVKSLPLVAGWNPYSTNMSYASGLER